MLDAITKALTIQISAEDLTGSAWSNLANGTKDAWNNVTALNQAWELAGKVYSALRDSMAAPIEALSAGGEYAEAKNGLENLAKSYGVNADAITASIRQMADGSLNLLESTKAASDALRMGFSSDQVARIWEFADRYTHVMGGDVLTVATAIEQSIFTGKAGKGKGAKTYGLNIGEGTVVTDIMGQLDMLKSKLGEGVFDFGDSFKKIGVGFFDMALMIKKEMNDLVGEAGFDEFSQSVIAAFKAIESEAPIIARGIFYPLADAATIAWKFIKDTFNLITGGLGMVFDNSDTVSVRITTLVLAVGNTIYDVGRQIGLIFQMVLPMVDVGIKDLAKNFDTLVDMATMAAKISSYLGGGINPEWIESLKAESDTFKQIAKDGLFQFDLGKLDEMQEKYNKTIMETGQAHADLRLKTLETAKGIEFAGEAFGKAEKAAKASKGEIESLISANMRWNVLSSTTVGKNGKSVTTYNDDFYGPGKQEIPTTLTRSGTTSANIPQTTQSATQRGGPLKIEVTGKDGALKELCEELIERITTKAVAEGLITAGV